MDDEWLTSMGDDNDSGAQLQVAAALSMIDGCDSDLANPPPERAAATAAPSSPAETIGGSSVANCTDTVPEHGIGGSGSVSSPTSSSVSTCVDTKEDKAAGRIARKNRARLYRCHRSKAELSGLRQETAELQALLDKLQQEEDALPPPAFEGLSCPFVDDARDEIDPREHARPLAAPAPVVQTELAWKSVAMREYKRRQRAHAVRRKLKRLLREYEKQAEALKKHIPSVQGNFASKKAPGFQRPRALPSIPGADSLEAFTNSSVAVLRELYHMACNACSITSASSAPLSKAGGELAYTFLLGSDIESGWTHNFSFPVNDPCNVAALMLCAIRSQQPQSNIVRELHKHHDTAHPLFERQFTLRHQDACGAPINLQGAMMTQTYEAADNAVIVWTLSLHSGESSAPPVFRSSGWSVFQRSSAPQGLAGQVTCRSSARVHCAPSHSLVRAEKTVERRPMVDAWSSVIRSKQQVMSDRLLLVL